MDFDLSQVPFSRYGSYIGFSRVKEGLTMRSFHGNLRNRNVFQIELVRNGQPVPFRDSARPNVLELMAEGGMAGICIPETKLVRIRLGAVGMRLSIPQESRAQALPAGPARVHICSHASSFQSMITVLRGRLAVEAPFNSRQNCNAPVAVELLPDEGGSCEAVIEEFRSGWKKRRFGGDFDRCAQAVRQEYEEFLAAMPAVPKKYARAAELAAYVMWSAVVEPCGNFGRPAMLMSKNWMTSLWSWDHCFNAMALIEGHPGLAWDQFMLILDHQDDAGCLPDSMNDAVLDFRWCKPPVHGWALRRMMERTKSIGRKRLAEVYERLARWTNWWMDFRDYDGDGLPQYNHGNDSGWDNATVFDIGYPVEGPDLAAFLAIQMDVLADIAGRLGKQKQARQWRERSSQMVGRLVEHFWRGGQFVFPRSGDHSIAPGGDCLMSFLPILLGRRLPAAVRHRLLAGLKDESRFLTPHGVATESPHSAKYEPDGYWRGPVWAPSTMIIVEGLAACGGKNLAKEIARRFCDTCTASGFAENYNALTGEGLRDRAYTWSASVFFLLAHEYLR